MERFFAISFAPNSDERMHHPVQESIELAMADADTMLDQDAQVVRVTGLKAVVASREAGQPWRRP